MYSLDDNSVWYVYERNRDYYYNCTNKLTCPNYYNDECMCHYHQIVFPYRFYECGFPRNKKIEFSTKMYISFGQTCPICLESILHKKDAWLTPCGHGFHRNCIIDTFEHYMNNKNRVRHSNTMPCPICREDLVDCCIGKLTIDRYKGISLLDRLENFWLTIDKKLIITCHKCDETLGFNINCHYCMPWKY